MNIVTTCLDCQAYLDCPRRRSRMKKVKDRHGTNSRADVRFRIAALEWIAKGCDLNTR